MEQKFENQLLDALIHVGYSLLYFLILLPAFVWKRSTITLALAKQNNVLKYDKIESPWPFLSYLKRITFDFVLDFIIFILPVAGLGYGIYSAIDLKDFWAFVIIVVGAYYAMPAMILVKDMLLLVIIAPFRKYLSWIKKPAQHVDLTMDKELK